VPAGDWRGLAVAVKTVVFQSDLWDGPITRVASETVIASNLVHPNIVATYSHDISTVGKAAGDPELGVYKFYLIQVCVQVPPQTGEGVKCCLVHICAAAATQH
jgi:hypothetical protein